MIRLITCIKRKKGISSEEFRNYWNDPQFEIHFDRVVSLQEQRTFLDRSTKEYGMKNQRRMTKEEIHG